MSPALFAAYKLIKIFIYPLTWILLLLAAAFALSWRTRRGGSRALLLLGALLLYGLSIQPVSHAMVWSLERFYPARTEWETSGGPARAVERYDAIVVLGGGVDHKGGLRPEESPSPPSLDRLLYGRRLLMRGLSTRIVFSGGNADPFSDRTPEATVMKRTLESLGKGDWSIETETRSRTTYESAVEVSRLLGKRKNIALVTSAIHMPRSMALFRKQGFDATAFPCDFAFGPTDLSITTFIPSPANLERSTQAVNEWVGIVVYWAAGKMDLPTRDRTLRGEV